MARERYPRTHPWNRVRRCIRVWGAIGGSRDCPGRFAMGRVRSVHRTSEGVEKIRTRARFDADGRTPDIDDPEGDLARRRCARQAEGPRTGSKRDASTRDLVRSGHLRAITRRLGILARLAWQGDLLYFDEAFDSDERRLLNEYILPSGKYACVGATSTGLGLQILEIDGLRPRPINCSRSCGIVLYGPSTSSTVRESQQERLDECLSVEDLLGTTADPFGGESQGRSRD